MGVQGTVQPERQFERVPEGWYTGKLVEVDAKPLSNGSRRIVWKWQIIEPSEWAYLDNGLERHVWGRCFDELDPTDGCVWRRWHETLLGAARGLDAPVPVSMSEHVNSDDVLNAIALIYVTHRPFEKDGEDKISVEVAEEPNAIQLYGTDTRTVILEALPAQAILPGRVDEPAF